MNPPKQQGIEIDLQRDHIVLNALAQVRTFASMPFPTFADVQTTAATLRLLLIYDELTKTANSRRVKLLLEVKDAKENQALARQGKISFYALGAPGLIAPKGVTPLPAAASDITIYSVSEREIPAEREHQTVLLSGGPFLKQSCLFQAGMFVTRQEVISYFTNKRGGAHYEQDGGKSVSAETLDLIERLRAHIRFKFDGHAWTTQIPVPDRLKQPLPPPETFEYAPDELDVVGVQFLGTARAVVQSQSVIELEAKILHDLRAASRKNNWPET
jgi:hypothetical protein